MQIRTGVLSHIAFAALAAMIALVPTTTRADVMWTLQGVTLGDGGTATGTFVTNDSGVIQSWDILTTAGSVYPGETYDSSSTSVLNSATTYGFNVQSDDGADTMILLGELTGLLAVNSPDQVLTNSFEQQGYDTPRYVTAGSFVVASSSDVAEPVSIALLGSGLVGLAIARRRSRGPVATA